MIRPDIHHPTGNQSMWRPRLPPLLAAVLIAIFVITAALSVRNTSSSWDDPYHLTGGIAQLQTKDPRLNADHPPLARLIAAIPTLFIKVDSVAEHAPSAWESADLFQSSSILFGAIEDQLLWPSRLIMLSFSILLGWLVYAWSSQLFGSRNALLPLILFAFCPPLLAYAPLVTTDMAATAFIFASLYGWWRYLTKPSLRNLLWTCVGVTATFATKHTALLLIPLFLFLGIIAITTTILLTSSFRERLWTVGGGLLVIGLTTLVSINLVYFFDGSFLTPQEYIARAHNLVPYHKISAERLSQYWPTWLPVPLPFYYVLGLINLFTNVGQGGHATYFLGEAGYGGWTNYFLVMLLVKLSLPTLILVFLGVLRAFDRFPEQAGDLLFLVLPPLLLIWIASIGKMQIGIRHILPAFPFLLLLAGYILHHKITYWGKSLFTTLLILNCFSSLSVHPYYLMYFNFLAGGPEQGWRISITGDDYGQGDADLLRWLQARGVKEIAFGPFGWGTAILNRAGIITKPIPCDDTGELVAIHVGQMALTYTLEKHRCYSWMRLRKPDEKIGYNIFLYNTKNNAPRPSPPADLNLFNQALALQLKGEKAQSISVYRQYLLQGPDYYQARFNLACALMDTGQCEAAIPEFERTLALWPGYKEAHLYLATCYRQLGRKDEEQRHAEEYRKQ